jgi:replicative DNA helicase
MEHNISSEDFSDMPRLLLEVVRKFNARVKCPNLLSGILTGFAVLDRFTCGLQHGNLIVLAGRPCMGEDVLALNIVEHVALVDKLPVAIFDMEIGNMNLSMRLLASNSKVNYYDLRHGKIDNEQSDRVLYAAEVLKDASMRPG